MNKYKGVKEAMKVITFSIVAILSCVQAFALSYEEISKLTPEERKAEAEEARMRATGGMIRKRDALDGKLGLLNAQKTVASDKIVEGTKTLFTLMNIPYEIKDIEDSVGVGSAKSLIEKYGVAVGVFVVDDPTLDIPMLVAPEGKWALVNVAVLKQSAKNQNFVDARTCKELVRAVLYVCGAADSNYKGSIMKGMTNPRSLDNFASSNAPIDVIGRTKKYLPYLGISPEPMTTYRVACEQGWAPAPTNDYQKAVWDSVHAVPDKPIVIKFDAQRDSGK